ncbi:probable G-protein coupled receptor Mth-like 3 isoform X4 [Spodoptera litura]|uniref:Probable G-protein coupled receptor Mth-like 3 isoform X4 n=1 Tax=Spodoptera litura TaxID=69820 RepID=A0A9J7ESB7_SPOLT|nr:probable G-protein coupled receptor Mth-like 3 isoform X4 [Spodoptera litura]
MWVLLTLFTLVGGVLTQSEPCDYDSSVELNNRTFNGVLYNEGEFYYDNLTNTERGCICMKETCVRKCCNPGFVYNATKNVFECQPDNKPDEFTRHLKVHQGFNLIPREAFHPMKKFHFIYGIMDCDQFNDSVPIGLKRKDLWRLLTDGKLYVKIDTSVKVLIYDASKYCIDTFVSDTEEPHLNALICFVPKPEHNNYTMSSSCMLISCFFILLTVAVYAWLPELRNLHGMVLMAYLLSFFVGFLFLATMQILILLKEISEDICIVLTFIIYFSLLAAFFWLNVMCYDIWWTFSGKRAHGRSGSQNKRFLCYAIYAFGVPTILTIVMAALEFSNIPLHPLLPKLRLQGCFLYGNSKLLYLYGPIVILCVANLIFFALTAFKIAKIKKETKMLRDKESSTHDQDRKDTQRFTLYVKLFTVMGINWILEVVSSFYPEADVFWQFSDAYNVLVGLIIFIIFVCKKKTWRMIKKRIKDYQRSKSNNTQQEINGNNRRLAQWRTQPDRTSSLETIRTTDGERSSRSNKSVNINPH